MIENKILEALKQFETEYPDCKDIECYIILDDFMVLSAYLLLPLRAIKPVNGEKVLYMYGVQFIIHGDDSGKFITIMTNAKDYRDMCEV